MTQIYDLHPEIISLIFENAKNMTDETLLTDDISISEVHNGAFEITASGICSYLRKIALTTPRLWTSIHVHGSCHLKYINTMLTRSYDCWLDIRIDLAVQDCQMDISRLDPIVDKLLLHSPRWRSLCMGYSCERRDHPVVMKLCSSIAPGLQHLSITVDDVDQADGTLVNRAVDLPHIFQDGTPKLNFVRFRGFAIQLFRPPLYTVVTLHLDQIKSLPIHYSTLNGILTCSPFLAHLSMYGDILPQGGWESHWQDTILLPALRSLRVCSISGEAFVGVLKNIEAPNLEALTLKSLHEHDLDALWASTDNTKFDRLRSLNFDEFDLSASTCKHIFKMFPQITAFSAIYASRRAHETSIIEVLAQGSVEDQDGALYVPWPKLTTLCLGSDFYDNGQEVMDMLLSARRDNGSPISTLLIKLDMRILRSSSVDRSSCGLKTALTSIRTIYYSEATSLAGLKTDTTRLWQ